MHVAIAAAAVTLLLPAHAAVIGSTPQDGSTVTAQPGAFSVVLNEPMLSVPGAASSSAMRLTDAAGRFYGDGCTTVDGASISLDAQLGAAGDYTLTYQVVSADGHTVSGDIGFAFEPADGAAGAEGAVAAPVCGAATESDASESTASANQGVPAETDEPAAEAGSQPPFLAIGVLAVLAVLAVIAYRTNRLRNDRADDA
jgi:methionine-rich copper-binding protein CopC